MSANPSALLNSSRGLCLPDVPGFLGFPVVGGGLWCGVVCILLSWDCVGLPSPARWYLINPSDRLGSVHDQPHLNVVSGAGLLLMLLCVFCYMFFLYVAVDGVWGGRVDLLYFLLFGKCPVFFVVLGLCWAALP